jgi:hypothetical protein
MNPQLLKLRRQAGIPDEVPTAPPLKVVWLVPGWSPGVFVEGQKVALPGLPLLNWERSPDKEKKDDQGTSLIELVAGTMISRTRPRAVTP